MLLSVILPVFNEEAVIPHLLGELEPVLVSLNCDYEIVFVDDGSKDATPQLLRELSMANAKVKFIRFSRNFGQQAAITAGLDIAQGDVVLVMDADLQDPPSLIPTMLEKIQEGYDVVSARKNSRQGESFWKKKTATLFYEIMRRNIDERLPAEVGDFRMFTRSAVEAIKAFREQHRFMRGLVAWLGLRECILTFDRPARAAGETKYSVLKLVRLAWTAISSFSAFPLRLALYGGMMLTSIGALYSLYAVYAAIFNPNTAPGWSSLICFQLLFNGATLTAVGLVGDYVGRVFEESKKRPLYIVSDMARIDTSRSIDRAIYLQRLREPAKSGGGEAGPAESVLRVVNPEVSEHSMPGQPAQVPPVVVKAS